MSYLVFILFFITSIQTANACVCGDWDYPIIRDLQEEDFNNSVTLIIGHINKISIKKIRIRIGARKLKTNIMILSVKIISVRDNKIIKKTIKLASPIGLVSCGYPFKAKETYFISISEKGIPETKKAIYKTNLCMPTKNIKYLKNNDTFLIEKYFSVNIKELLN